MRQRLQGRYEIEGPLGRGGMGTIVAARDRESGLAVAIKWIGEVGSLPSDKELRRFEQEAKIAGSLASPHVTRVLDIGRDPESGVPYLVMERLHGEDVQALLDRVGALSVGAAVVIARQAALGLAEAHAAGIVHRDVKPSNLFLAKEPSGLVVVKILDFGIAKIKRFAAEASRAFSAPLVSMTKSGELLGSPLYMSPEQVEASRHVDARTDVFSMGVTLHALLSGRAPHAHLRSFAELLYTIVNTPAPPVESVAPWVPAEVAEVVNRAMAHAVEARFADGSALLTALRALAPEGDELREEQLVPADKTALVEDERGEPEISTLPVEAAPTVWQRIRATFR
jgi:serine/threonine protein kinase